MEKNIEESGLRIGADGLARPRWADSNELLRTLKGHGRNLGVVLAGKKAAYVERNDEAFMYEVRKYYHSHVVLADQLDFDDDIIKIAIFDFDDAESGTAPHLLHLRETHAVVISGEHWIDIMDPRINKGTAVQALQRELGVTREQTIAFGDYLNDLEMMRESGPSFATANAHEGIIEAARFVAPSNVDEGVIQVLENVLGK